MAASIDAANHAVLIAWAIAESESEDAWRFFPPFSSPRFYTFSHPPRFFSPNIHTAIPEANHPSVTIMSGEGLRAADNEIPRATRAICLEHLSRNLQKNCGLAARNIPNSAIRFALAEEKLQGGMDELQEASPQAVDYLGGIDLAFWTTPYFPGKRYGHSTSNVVEIMNSWIIEERKLQSLTCSTHYGARTWAFAFVIFKRPRSTILLRFSRPSYSNSQCNSAITSLFGLLILITLLFCLFLVNDIVSPVFPELPEAN